MHRVHQVIPEVLAALLRKAPLCDDKVAFAWRTAVGVAVDKATTVTLIDGVLHVRTRDAAWQREVERARRCRPRSSRRSPWRGRCAPHRGPCS